MNKDLKKQINQSLNKNQEIYEQYLCNIENNLLFFDKKRQYPFLVSKQNKELFLKNKYLQNIKFEELKDDKIEVKNVKFYKNQLFFTDEYIIDGIDEVANIGYFDEDVYFPVLYEDNEPWMSIVPSEINTMNTDINKMYGNVLILGCGLGYIAYMLSQKENIKKITVVEKNEKIIDIFNKNILPQINKEIEIINMDAFDFLDLSKNDYDFIYCDIWFNGIDGLELYLKLKPYEKKFNAKFLYWIENEILQQLRIAICEDLLENNPKRYNNDFFENVQNINHLRLKLSNESLLYNYLPGCNFIL